MSKDQAARIADTTTTGLLKRDHPSRVMEWEDEMQRLALRIRRAITTAVRKERERCVKCAESETEMFDPMPDAAWEWLNGNKERTCELAVTIVKATKDNIINAINGGKR